jgi:hypothetical protein
MRQFGTSKRSTRSRSSCGSFPGEYTKVACGLREPVPAEETCDVTFDSHVSSTQRAYVLSQVELFCGMCGIAPGDIDDLSGCRAQFDVSLIAHKDPVPDGKLSNLQTLCSTCAEGAKNITSVKPPSIWLLSQIRRAGQEEQRAVLDWLLKKFKE